MASSRERNLLNSWVSKYIGAGLIWGSSFLFIAIGGQALPAVGVAFWRLLVGAVTMFAIAKATGARIPRDARSWAKMWIAGLFMSAIPFVLFAYAEQHVSSALAGILNAATPVTTVLMILIFFRDERPNRQTLVGLTIGLIGVAVVLGVWQGFGTSDPTAVLALVGAISCYGFGTPFMRRFVGPLGLPAAVSTFGQISTAMVTLAPFYLFGPLTIGPVDLKVVAAMLALGALGSGIAYWLYYGVIAAAGSTIASSVTLITPLVAVTLGITLLGEKLHWYEPVGAVIVIAGAAWSQGYFKRKRAS
jgi:drug/metabolite transporter (DMT)-like permease